MPILLDGVLTSSCNTLGSQWTPPEKHQCKYLISNFYVIICGFEFNNWSVVGITRVDRVVKKR